MQVPDRSIYSFGFKYSFLSLKSSFWPSAPLPKAESFHTSPVGRVTSYLNRFKSCFAASPFSLLRGYAPLPINASQPLLSVFCATTFLSFGYYSSWPLFAFAHHSAEKVYPGETFLSYAMMFSSPMSVLRQYGSKAWCEDIFCQVSLFLYWLCGVCQNLSCG
jgi:hypothetical protein